jgi:hypothetical protein
MISLVEQLQAEALDPSVSVVSLLLKAKALATKLAGCGVRRDKPAHSAAC